MTTVYFERSGYAEKILTLENDEHYEYLLTPLMDMAINILYWR